MKTSAEFTKKHKGEPDAIEAAMSSLFRRELTEDDLEIIRYFVNGYA